MCLFIVVFEVLASPLFPWIVHRKHYFGKEHRLQKRLLLSKQQSMHYGIAIKDRIKSLRTSLTSIFLSCINCASLRTDNIAMVCHPTIYHSIRYIDGKCNIWIGSSWGKENIVVSRRCYLWGSSEEKLHCLRCSIHLGIVIQTVI